MIVKKIVFIMILANGCFYYPLHAMKSVVVRNFQADEGSIENDVEIICTLFFQLNKSAQAMLNNSSHIEDKAEMLRQLDENDLLNKLLQQECQKEYGNLYRLFGLYLKNATADFKVFERLYKAKKVGAEAFKAYRELYISLDKKYDTIHSLQPQEIKSNLNRSSKSHKSL